MDTQYMEILERLKTHHLLTSSAVDSRPRGQKQMCRQCIAAAHGAISV